MKPGETFTSHGHTYEIEESGAVHQTDAQPFIYDKKYTETYNTPEYLRESELLQVLRYAYCTLAFRGRITSLLDVGYGAGQFMRFARKYTPLVYGYDVTGVQVEDCKILDFMDAAVDVVTFWDVWEHMEDHSFARDLKCNTLVISLPYCHIHTEGVEWFSNGYKHRKKNEHVYHHNPQSLENELRSLGWNLLNMPDYFEDVVRKSTHGLQNIHSAAFKR